jgi:hypothetical protein
MVKQPELKADLSPATGAEVKRTWNYAFTPTYVFMK